MVRRGTTLRMDDKEADNFNQLQNSGSAYVCAPQEEEEDPGSPKFFSKMATRRFSLLSKAVTGERRHNMVLRRPNKNQADESDEESEAQNSVEPLQSE